MLDAFGYGLGGLDVVGLFEEHDELVSTQAGNCIARPDTPFEPSGRLLKKLVSHHVAKAIIDHFEAVKIEENDGTRVVFGAVGPSQSVPESVHEECPVRQVGQAIIEGIAQELLLGLLPLGDVHSRTTMPEERAIHIKDRNGGDTDPHHPPRLRRDVYFEVAEAGSIVEVFPKQ